MTADPTADGRVPIATGRLTPNDRGLDASAMIAERLGIRFSRQQTAKHSQELATLYFKDIADTVPHLVAGLDIEQGSINSIDAFIEPYKTQGWVFVDDRLDIWLFGLNVITTFKACYRTEDDEDQQLSEWIKEYLAMATSSHLAARQMQVRNETEKLFSNYADMLLPANALSISMIVFIMCHEIAHAHLGHLDQPENPDNELAADQLAYDIFLRIAEKRDQLAHAQIDQSTTSAPCLMLCYFRALTIASTGKDIGTTEHPPVSERIDALLARGKASWSEASKMKYDELSKQFNLLANYS